MITLPVFPLPLVLFPEEELPLHIFEDRYREMIRYCREKNCPFGVASYINNSISKVGCVAKLERIHKIYADGGMDIVCSGGDRFLIHGFDTSRSFLQATVTYFHDDEKSEDFDNLKDKILPMLREMMELQDTESLAVALPGSSPFSFKIAHLVGFGLAQKQNLLEIKSEKDRLIFIHDHLNRMLPRLLNLKDLKRKVKSNGYFRNFPPINFKV